MPYISEHKSESIQRNFESWAELLGTERSLSVEALGQRLLKNSSAELKKRGRTYLGTSELYKGLPHGDYKTHQFFQSLHLDDRRLFSLALALIAGSIYTVVGKHKCNRIYGILWIL